MNVSNNKPDLHASEKVKMYRKCENALLTQMTKKRDGWNRLLRRKAKMIDDTDKQVEQLKIDASGLRRQFELHGSALPLATGRFASCVECAALLALFIDSPLVTESFSNPQMIWLVCPLVLYLLMRIWVLARRNEMHDDPVVFLMTDWRSQIMIGLGAVIMLGSQLLAPWVM